MASKRVTAYQYLIALQAIGAGAIIYQLTKYGASIPRGMADLAFIIAHIAIWGGLLIALLLSVQMIHRMEADAA